MNLFRSLHLQKHLGEVLSSSEAAPSVIVNRGQPRHVIMSVAEFRRLKQAAGEPVPSLVMPRSAAKVRGPVDDPLGYDTSDLLAYASASAEAALSGRDMAAVAAEAERAKAAIRLAAQEGRLPKLILPDGGPLKLLALLGGPSLREISNCFEVVIVDTVRNEALGDPYEDVSREEWREFLCAWLTRSRNKIHMHLSPEGLDYGRAMRTWTAKGRPPDGRPPLPSDPDRAIRDIMPEVGNMVNEGDIIFLLVDQRSARASLLQAAWTTRNECDIDLLNLYPERFKTMRFEGHVIGTMGLLKVLADVGRVPDQSEAWKTLLEAQRPLRSPIEAVLG